MEGYPSLTPDPTRELIYRVLETEQQKRLKTNRQIDSAYGGRGLARFRVNGLLPARGARRRPSE